MEIIKYINPYFPNEDRYKCTIGTSTLFGNLREVEEWREDQILNEGKYLLHDEVTRKATASFYETLTYKGD
tara:strand:+ start:4896 stop:5108 length:213 start_codon:yes stop_codon:yes gene_type:complete